MTKCTIYVIKFLVALLAFAVVAACSGDDDDNDVTSRTKLAKVFSGDQLGHQTAVTAQLREDISVIVTNPDSRIQINNPVKVRPIATADSVHWIIPVKNIGTKKLCFIAFTNGVLYSQSGTQLAVHGNSYVNGNIGNVGALTDIYTDTCVAEGNTGYIIGIEINPIGGTLYSDTASIIFNSISATEEPVKGAFDLTVSAEATGYTAVQSASNIIYREVDLSVSNLGSSSVQLGLLSLYLILDQNSQPLYGGFFGIPTDSTGIIGTNGTGTLRNYIQYEGSSNKLSVFLDFEPVVQIAALSSQYAAAVAPYNVAIKLQPSSFANSEEYLSYLIDQKNQKTLAILNLVSSRY